MHKESESRIAVEDEADLGGAQVEVLILESQGADEAEQIDRRPKKMAAASQIKKIKLSDRLLGRGAS